MTVDMLHQHNAVFQGREHVEMEAFQFHFFCPVQGIEQHGIQSGGSLLVIQGGKMAMQFNGDAIFPEFCVLGIPVVVERAAAREQDLHRFSKVLWLDQNIDVAHIPI